MKLINLTLAFLLFSNFIFAQYTPIPDVNFEKYLINKGYDYFQDGQVLTSNISSLKYLDIDNYNITDLTGISSFKALTNLYCSNNNIKSLDLSNNLLLEYLRCYSSHIESLNIKNNTKLLYLTCNDNSLTNLDLSKNANLISLDCNFNNLTSLSVSENNLLKYLNCSSNEISHLDVSRNPYLRTLDCGYNHLTSLDLSNNPNINFIECSWNNLYSLNLKNGNNDKIDSLDTFGNPKLYCITVDDPLYTITNWNGLIDFNINSNSQYTDELCGINLIKGNISYDKNKNCIKDSDDKGIPNIVVKADGEKVFYASTDHSGNYRILVDSNQTYNVNAISFPDLLLMKSSCPQDGYEINSGNNGTITENINFSIDIKLCAMLSVDISRSRMRRCFQNNTSILYKNDGSMDENNAKIFVDYPEYVKIVSADKTFNLIDAEKNIYVFDIGTIAAFASGTINIVDEVICGNESIRGLTQCVKAWITPKSYCAETKDTTAWDKSSIKVLEAKCITDSVALFVIVNEGTGDMQTAQEYRFYYDNEFAHKGTFKLNSGDSLAIDVTADGSTIRLEADQHPMHPGNSKPRTTLEACGAETPDKVSLGFWVNIPPDDLDYDIAEVCLEILDSYDPNDKKVLPAGITAEHYVSETGDLKYTIRFQNTGSDVAYKIIVVDSLSESLDISTLNILGASHSYNYNVTGTNTKVLTFTFNNINLPDSTTNEAASHGFVSFSISPIQGIAKGTKIENFADIYFDFNSAVRTDTAWVTALDTVIASSKIITVTEQSTLGISETKLSNIKIYPNPTNEFLFVKNANSEFSKIELFDIKGSLILTENLISNEQKINVNSLQKGIYFIHLSNEKSEIKTFKMVK